MQTKNIYTWIPCRVWIRYPRKPYILSGFHGKQHAFFHGFGAHVILFLPKKPCTLFFYEAGATFVSTAP